MLGLGATEVFAIINWLVDNANEFGIDSKKIDVYGHSSERTSAQYCGALDPRIAGIMASGSVGLFENTIAKRGVASGLSVIPGILNWFEASDVIPLAAPRSFIAVSRARDHIFPYKGVKTVVEEASLFYRKLITNPKISASEADGGHKYYGQCSLKFFKSNILI